MYFWISVLVTLVPPAFKLFPHWLPTANRSPAARMRECRNTNIYPAVCLKLRVLSLFSKYKLPNYPYLYHGEPRPNQWQSHSLEQIAWEYNLSFSLRIRQNILFENTASDFSHLIFVIIRESLLLSMCTYVCWVVVFSHNMTVLYIHIQNFTRSLAPHTLLKISMKFPIQLCIL